jgi:MtN3 and saliva related transmembrane protein
MVDIIGYIAAVLTSVSFVPQAFKIIKTKDTSAISAGMYSLMTFGMLLWLIYGIIEQAIPIIAANGVSFVLTSIILVMKLTHK